MTDLRSAQRRTSTRLDRGASLVEYALLVALIAIVCVAAVTYFGTQSQSSFNKTGSSIQAAS